MLCLNLRLGAHKNKPRGMHADIYCKFQYIFRIQPQDDRIQPQVEKLILILLVSRLAIAQKTATVREMTWLSGLGRPPDEFRNGDFC